MIILIFSIFLFILIKFFSILHFSSEPSIYSGGAGYFLRDVLTSGHLITQQGAFFLSKNVFSANIVEYARYPFFPSLYIILSLFSGITMFSWTERIVRSILFALPIMLILLSIYFSVSQRLDKKIDYKFIFLISLYSLMASPYVINQLGANGWLFILFVSYLIFIQPKDRWEFSLLSVLFLAILPAAYFTGSSFFILWISITMSILFIIKLGVYEKLNLNKIFDLNITFRKSYTTIFLILIVCYIGYAIYISTNRFIPALDVFINVINTIMDGFSGFETSSPLLSSRYIIETSLESKLRNLINGILVAAPVILLFVYRKRLIELKETTLFLFAGILALPCLTILTFFWLGQFGLVRLQEYGSLISLIIVPVVSSVLVKKEKIMLAVIIILAIISSIFTYCYDESIQYRYISNQEEYGAHWMKNNVNMNSSIFTDHRLSGTFISNGFLRTTGITEFGKNSTELIDQIYYYDDSKNVSHVIRSFKVKYIYFSKSMMSNASGIMLYNYPIKPASDGFFEKYDSNSDFNKLYDNGQSFVYDLDA